MIIFEKLLKDMRIFYVLLISIISTVSMNSCHDRPVCISENGRYFSAFDGQIHTDNMIFLYR